MEPADLVTINEAAQTVQETWVQVEAWIRSGDVKVYTRPGARKGRVSLAQVRDVARWRLVVAEGQQNAGQTCD